MAEAAADDRGATWWGALGVGLDVAEPAAASAGVPEQHEGRGAAVPALRHVRAAGFLADRVQAAGGQDAAQSRDLVAVWNRHLEPARQAMAQLFTDKVVAEVRGRVAVLAAHRRIRAVDLNGEVQYGEAS